MKQCTRKYPTSHLSKQELTIRGAFHSVVKRNDRGIVDSLALVWLDKNKRYFVATAGDITLGDNADRIRLRETDEGPQYVQLSIPQPNVVQMHYISSAAIDQHNRCRQDDLMLQRKLGTHRWDFRLNCSLIGMITVDA